MNVKSLSSDQLQVLTDLKADGETLEGKDLLAIASGQIHVGILTDEKLVSFVTVANAMYRAGYPVISDGQYDQIFYAELVKRLPDHPFVIEVEPEPVDLSKTIDLPVKMLSTDKAYDFASINRWAKRIEKAATELQIDFGKLLFRGTPKLDGFAAYDDGKKLYTRGDGKKGTDITRAFDRGLQVAMDGARGLGAGEIVVDKNYFNERLAEFFDNSRNFQASLIKEKELETPVLNAVKEGAAAFCPFALLPDWQGSWEQLADGFDTIVEELWNSVPYDIDGVVFEVLDADLCAHMGATRHHHRWQIAFKKNTEKAIVKVLQVLPQTSRSGRINPVAEVEPVRLSGAKISRVTAHHYGMVKDMGIGPGAEISLTRSGEVIPKIEEVVKPALVEDLQLPESCPSCDGDLAWDGDYLYCQNKLSCPSQLMNSVEHFFKVLGNIDGFGPSSIEKLYANNTLSIPQLYKMNADEFEAAGFGPKQAENMVTQLQRSRAEQIEDWRFLAAFGVQRLGQGNCEKLLEYFPLTTVFGLGKDDIIDNVKGFQEKTASAICVGLVSIKEQFDQLYELGFNLSITPLLSEQSTATSEIAGKTIVFTGSMESGSRPDMEKMAKGLGAKVGKGITGKTDILVTGAKVGASKMNKAQALNVQILTELQYNDLIN